MWWGTVIATASLATGSGFSGGDSIDAAIQRAISDGQLPGAVVVVGHDGRVVYRKAYGNRSESPTTEPMTLDTVFDVASLTKVIATTSCMMKLYEAGKWRPSDPVTQTIPEFMGGKSSVTVRNLLTHFSGLKPDVPLHPAWTGYNEGIRLACTYPPSTGPGLEHVYSDINFILLGEMVHRLSGQTLADYSRNHIFLPLGMKDTMYLPPKDLIPRIAPTERMTKDGLPLRGVVHDPTARNMGGVAGHAGLFSTADDLSRFAQMMLNKGTLGDVKLYDPRTVQKFTEPQTPLEQPVLRGFGWDIDSDFSGNRGGLFPIGSYGHTGFTGTSIWIDPFSDTYVILLANAVHPNGRPPITSLRYRVATIVAASLGIKHQQVKLTGYNDLGGDYNPRLYGRNAQTKTGLDVLEADGFQVFKGKKIGLVTNQSGLDRAGHRNIDAMRAAGVDIAMLFSPEHGFGGNQDHPGIADDKDAATGVTIKSLYGKELRPSPESLKGLDALVFDIQDAGVRFYTYETTLGYCLESAAQAHVPFYVLDRPNPIGGLQVEGPLLAPNHTSFVAYLPGTPVRHGMTMGELAQMFNGEKHLGADLHVVAMEDWQRGDWFDSTGLNWINPSPNLRSLNAATLYPGICLVEFAKNISVGRGTDAPFEQVGADFINGPELANYLNRRKIPGLRVYATRFTPTESRFATKTIEGVRFDIVDRHVLSSVRVGLELAVAIQKLYPGKVDWKLGIPLWGDEDVIRLVAAGIDPVEIEDSYREARKGFLKIRTRYAIYK